MSVADLLGQGEDFVCARPDQHLLDAARLMVSRNANALAVLAPDGKLAGILTDHDVMRALVSGDGDIEGQQVGAWMTHNVVTCAADARLDEALGKMGRHRIRHLVVVADGRPVGVLGIRALLAKIHQQDELEINVLRDVAVASRG